MILKNQKWYKVLELLFEYPDQTFTIREIATRVRIPSSSVQRYVTKLRKGGFITADIKLVVNPYTKFIKTFFIIDMLFYTGFLDYVEKTMQPSVVILFGSARKGEYTHLSDIDLFIETTKSTIPDLSFYQRKLGHPLQLFVEKSIKDLPPRLMNNVINGIKLAGYFKMQ